jgi:microcystin-dependent protein
VSQPFLSEIKIMSFGFAPKGWAQCNGQLLPINQNQALFSLLGTVYGGNGQTTFALPDLRGCVPLHEGSGHTLGEKAGAQAVTLNINQLPTHNHDFSQNTAVVSATANATVAAPTSNYWANNGSTAYSTGGVSLGAMAPQAVSTVGGSQAHLNMQPFLALNFCIALLGIFPSQN